MSEPERAIQLVELRINELKLKPGAKLAIILPEDWSVMTIARFQHHLNIYSQEKGWDFHVICFPHGCELATISPDGGFTDEG